MSTNEDFKIETISEDNDLDASVSISDEVKAFDSGNADDDKFFVNEKGELLSCTRPWTGWYRKRGSVWKICKDSDGYRVRKPGGGVDSWGRGYSWNDVKSGYGLSGIRAHRSTCGPACF